MKRYSPTGRSNHGRPLKGILDTWDRNGSTSCPTPWQIYDDDDWLLSTTRISDLKTSTLQQTILTRNRQPFLRRESKRRSQQTSGSKPTPSTSRPLEPYVWNSVGLTIKNSGKFVHWDVQKAPPPSPHQYISTRTKSLLSCKVRKDGNSFKTWRWALQEFVLFLISL